MAMASREFAGSNRADDAGENEEDLPGALSGLRVIDFGQYVAGPLVGMILADNGADVIRVDPPGGPRWSHHANAILQRGKRSIVLDLKDAGERDRARTLIAGADVVIEGFRPGVMERLGVGPSAMTAINSRLVYLSLPGFAHDDPRAHLAGWEGIVSVAATDYTPPTSFITTLTSEAEGEPSFSAHPVASTLAAIVGVNSVLAALIARNRSGRGQAIEVPLFSAMFEVLNFDAQRITPAPGPIRLGPLIMGECADGRFVQILLMVPRHHRWFTERCFPSEWLAEGFGDPAWVREDPQRVKEFQRRTLELLKTRPAEEWDRIVNEAGVPATMFKTTEEWLDDEQAKTIGASIRLWDPELGETVQAGYPVLMDRTPPRARGSRHGVDEDREEILAEIAESPPVAESPFRGGSTGIEEEPFGGFGSKESFGGSKGPLEGIRVIDLTIVMAGPSAGRVLAELGAEVVKINEPDYPIGLWAHPNCGKRTALVNLRSARGP
jgi:crotonobetainyl-CoA:carnitine CoA-transferase CaiB-like acyl-CoA transferase